MNQLLRIANVLFTKNSITRQKTTTWDSSTPSISS
jgi:hypothetical protein